VQHAVTDDLSGVAQATCTFLSPSFQQRQSCTAVLPSPGTVLDGTFSCSIVFPRYSETGTWTAQVTLDDAVGNSQTIFPQFLLLPFEITVTSDPDALPPALTTFLFTTAVNVSAASQTVSCSMTVTDAKSGVNVAFCGFEAPHTDQAQGCAAGVPSSGTRNSGVFSCSYSMPRYADAGTWTPSVFLVDRVGNFSSPPVAGTLSVTASPEDVMAPALIDFSFSPMSVSSGEVARTVTCSFDVTDGLSGVGTAGCTFTYTDPFNPFLTQSQGCTATTPTLGTRNNGTFQCSVVIPRYSAGGLWDVDVQLMDRVGNVTDVTPVEQLDVDCSGGDIETTCRFASKTTLSWDALTDAEQYNVYRGDLADMIDLDMDQLPDGGYGTCQNTRDSDLTDTAFVDTDIPTLGPNGFCYLVSYTSSGVELGLGYSSFGNARVVDTPCP